MRKTPLFPTHLAAGAELDEIGGWLLPAWYGPERQAAVDREIEAARAGAGLADLSDSAVLVLWGEDTRRWINGMFTNKYADVEHGQGRRSVIADDRGRVHGLVDWYCLTPERFLGVLEGISADDFVERFERYLILDDIEHEVLDVVVLSLQGPATDGVLTTMALPVPVQDHDLVSVDPDAPTGQTVHICRRDRTGLGGVDLLVPATVAATTWAAAQGAGATAMGRLAFDALRIIDGRAAWPQDGTDKSMVHELGYNVDAVSFDKGCYLGQEVINRIERRGGVRKKLLRLRLELDALPPVGAEVLHGEDVVGTVSSATRALGEVWALSTLREGTWNDGEPVIVRAGDKVVPGRVVAR